MQILLHKKIRIFLQQQILQSIQSVLQSFRKFPFSVVVSNRPKEFVNRCISKLWNIIISRKQTFNRFSELCDEIFFPLPSSLHKIWIMKKRIIRTNFSVEIVIIGRRKKNVVICHKSIIGAVLINLCGSHMILLLTILRLV